MPIDWNEVRYRGDAQDVKELFEIYRVGVYLDTFEENARRREEGIRERFLKGGIRLDQSLSPRIFKLFSDLCRRLEIEMDVEVFCLASLEVNAMAVLDLQQERTRSLVGVTAGALEKLEDNELLALLGHELGHFLFGNNRMSALFNTDENNPSTTVLPPLGESLFLRWHRKAEISADRVGLLACGDFTAAARTLLKATFGLSDRNINLDIAALMAQIDEIKGHPEMMKEAFSSHPLLPIRLNALELLSRSEKARRCGYEFKGKALGDNKLEDGVDELILLSKRAPVKPLDQVVMELCALGGVMVLSADGDVSEEEVKILIGLLHHYFTDEPEKEIVTDLAEVKKRLPEVIERFLKEKDEGAANFVISRLADVALADGALLEPEGGVILEIAQQLGMPVKSAYSVMIGAAQAVGFRVDVKLNRIAEQLKRSLRLSLRA